MPERKDGPQQPTREEFLGKMSPLEKKTITRLTSTLTNLADTGQRPQKPSYFGLYGIGGNLTKEGQRPDIDLLIVSNAWWWTGFDFNWKTEGELPHRYDRTLMTIARKIEGTHTIEVLSKLPDSYNLGETKGKGLVRLTPKYADSQRPIDIVYIREVDLGNSSLEDFEEKDVDEGGEPLPKVLLASAEVHQFRFFDES
ncbi:hypothetical protein A3G67_00115 [Candidatus Roizmanbacteria bacterium RIFCSPLOWO2_12_FULL_40_12]|uniref:Uncharacterized protein n=1 Tax=Candidatus Roizmanbacteria bacterium RIFCSPLOWO2_01_FULL_40_42 TaxID=1802066 RepID=A0A1F7J5U6_9BACT|nr:MAG: hypothetical protein A2779_04865 [Candidatus Roizmanbacteria bacterium RIFCSPHIGHO2_01_FULL_40_98]OGK27792.1 MAG: hypothetical protein A3C31_04290 [Candidatus Roizmanbacteria bacterium RIFCSPHIGHO2_02_FULL_40_53]OGK30139.1 MAG: hypothetical protein A2W49_01325 [Candidatus Roizmanbacteria bacterium RIFCSPHIGHO2_12_41_18]OGK50989.1 MAG: hypothetical protein A3B50_03490 [Candidatus Roizmanbacteria bacterium RIFCSPLOWO2_01_FULL_40_42]OGK58537.1 MAG: hypothetical protein A3H84_00055 [Candida